MKLLIIAAVFLQLSLAVIRADVPGTYVNKTLLAMQPAAMSSDMCDGSSYYTTCGSSSCEEVRACLGPSTEYRYCRMINPARPFCNNGECSDVPVYSSSCIPTSIYCTGAGWFPDPFSCSVYHYCENTFSMSDVYQCPSGHVFNPASLLCKPRASDSDCMKINCNVNQVLANYGTSTRFFGFCQFMQGSFYYGANMYRCPEGTEFTGNTCLFKCSAEGRFPNSADRTAYYECIAAGDGTLSAVPRVCPMGKIFDAVKTACVTAPPPPA